VRCGVPLASHDRFAINPFPLVLYLTSQRIRQSHTILKIRTLLEPQVVAFEGWTINIQRQIATVHQANRPERPLLLRDRLSSRGSR
jgi:hypothetical protein